MIGPDFLLAGQAIFTVQNPRGEHFTFKIEKSDPTPQFPTAKYFAYVLAGPDNTSDYRYLGMIKEPKNARTVYHLHATQATRKAGYSEASPVFKVCDWAIKVIVHGGYSLEVKDGAVVAVKPGVPDGYMIAHAGRCGKCGRLLTNPESLVRGIGPECAGNLRVSAPARPPKDKGVVIRSTTPTTTTESAPTAIPMLPLAGVTVPAPVPAPTPRRDSQGWK
jgi:hypothetical protein